MSRTSATSNSKSANSKSKSTPSRVLTPAEAASIVFNVRAPSVEQIGRIVARINVGVIRRSEKGGMTTTTEAIAEFLSKREVAPKNQGGEKSSKIQETAADTRALRDRQEVNDAMSSCYRHFMRDYFRAVLFQRLSGQISTFMRSVVLVTQMGTLAIILLFAVSFIKGVAILPGVSPRTAAAVAWLKEHYSNVELEQIVAFPKEADTVRVKFTHVPEMRRSAVQDVILFRFQGNQIVKAFGDGDDD